MWHGCQWDNSPPTSQIISSLQLNVKLQRPTGAYVHTEKWTINDPKIRSVEQFKQEHNILSIYTQKKNK